MSDKSLSDEEIAELQGNIDELEYLIADAPFRFGGATARNEAISNAASDLLPALSRLLAEREVMEKEIEELKKQLGVHIRQNKAKQRQQEMLDIAAIPDAQDRAVAYKEWETARDKAAEKAAQDKIVLPPKGTLCERSMERSDEIKHEASKAAQAKEADDGN